MITTHDGVFHADETFAVSTPLKVEPYHQVVRTRDPKKFAGTLVDVGGVDDPISKKFDHHQKGFQLVHAGTQIPYAAFGLVWDVYGIQACGGCAKTAKLVERNLVLSIDATDNGVALWDKNQSVAPCTISHAISSFNPSWNEEQDFDGRFGKAVDFATQILNNEIARARGVVLAEEIIRASVSPDSPLLVLDRFVPWQENLLGMSEGNHVLFVVFPAANGKQWNVQAVPKTLGSFESKKLLPSTWGGLDANALPATTGVADAVFCHKGLFICGAGSKEGALQLALNALKE